MFNSALDHTHTLYTVADSSWRDFHQPDYREQYLKWMSDFSYFSQV